MNEHQMKCPLGNAFIATRMMTSAIKRRGRNVYARVRAIVRKKCGYKMNFHKMRVAESQWRRAENWHRSPQSLAWSSFNGFRKVRTGKPMKCLLYAKGLVRAPQTAEYRRWAIMWLIDVVVLDNFDNRLPRRGCTVRIVKWGHRMPSFQW